eukprot:330016-Pyramimonas_sp.AAC.1
MKKGPRAGGAGRRAAASRAASRAHSGRLTVPLVAPRGGPLVDPVVHPEPGADLSIPFQASEEARSSAASHGHCGGQIYP